MKSLKRWVQGGSASLRNVSPTFFLPNTPIGYIIIRNGFFTVNM